MIIKSSNQNYNSHKKETVKSVLKVIGMVLLVVIIGGAAGFVIKSIWNWLMPSIFNLGRITYWQGIGLFALIRILFGGINTDNSKSTTYEESNRRDKILKQKIQNKMQKDDNEDYTNEHTEETEESDSKEQNREDNIEQEKLYEEWWIQEGEAKFDEYIKNVKDSRSS
jgi:hypothetical protein